MVDLDIEWSFDTGLDEVDEDASSPLARALRAMLAEGRPQRTLRLLFFTPNLVRPDDTFWLGALVHSEGDRVIYFPSVDAGGFQMFHGRTADRRKAFAVDHISLERDHRGWHISGIDARHRMAGPGTAPLEPQGRLWFGLSVARPHLLRPVRRTNRLRFRVAESDAERRKRLLLVARRDAVDNVVTLNGAAFDQPPPWYVQFNFAVGPTGFAPDLQQLARWGHNPTKQSPHPTEGQLRIPSRLHRVDLSPDLDVLVAAFPLPGAPTDALALMAWG